MAREPNRRSGGIFGGRGSLREGLKDTSGNQRVGLEDTWLGDFIGLDGRIGAQGASLRQSWFGARRDGPGSAANIPNTRPTERPSDLRTTDDLELTYGPQNGRGGRRGTAPMTAEGPRTRPVVGRGGGDELDYGPQNGRGGRRGTVQSDVAPEVGDTTPTMSMPSVPSADVPPTISTSAPSLVTRPQPLPGVVDDNAPTIETFSAYPIRAKLESLLGPKSSYVTQVLPRVIQTKLTGGGQNDINGLVREVQSLPDSPTKQEVLNELYKMRDSMRGGGGGY